jgi:hypothetical protein
MTELHQPLFPEPYLRSVFGHEFESFRGSQSERELLERLEAWASKDFQKETSAESSFLHVFFEDTWGYRLSGKPGDRSYTCYHKYPLQGAGQGGGTGEADAALGWFARSDVPPTPQVLCEFKDVRSNLDAPQKRKRI